MPKARLTIGRGSPLLDKEFHIVAHQSAVISIMSYQQSFSLFHDNCKGTIELCFSISIIVAQDSGKIRIWLA